MNPAGSDRLPADWPLAPGSRARSTRHPVPDSLRASMPGVDPGAKDHAVSRRSRRKLWDLPVKLHCPLIGTCLDAPTLRKLAAKCGQFAGQHLGDYELHVRFVCAADEKNPLSLATQKTLEKRHAASVRRFTRAKSHAQLARLWHESLVGGDVPGAMWAALTHADCDDDLRTRIYEDIHMMSHQLGAGQRVNLHRYAETRDALHDLRQTHDEHTTRSRRQLAERDDRISALQTALEQAEDALQRLQPHCAALQDRLDQHLATDSASTIERLTNESKIQRRRIDELIRDRDEWRGSCQSERAQFAEFRSRHDTLAKEYAALERFVAHRLEGNETGAEHDDAQPTDLNGRQVLYVGGRNQLVDRYRALVERCNGHFNHHDGGREDNRSRLEAMMATVDTVFCATDCVSHDACLRLKRFCKRHHKQYVMLQSSGLSSFARAIESMAA